MPSATGDTIQMPFFSRVLLDIGHGEEGTARMYITRRFPDRTGLPIREMSCCRHAHGITHGGQRDRRALERVALGLPVQRHQVLAELFDTIIASRLGPAQAHGIAWNGAGDCLIFPQSREENISRTVFDHLPPPRRRLHLRPRRQRPWLRHIPSTPRCRR